MWRSSVSRFVIMVIAISAISTSKAADVEVDDFTGLKMTGNWELVRNNCISCHSLRLVTQQSGDEKKWLETIRWMQKTQNLWQIDADSEAKIIAYLAKNYPPRDGQRRLALAQELMPPNPYALKQVAN